MQCYSELIPPSAVTDSCALHLLSPDELNLAVAKTSLLQVFRTTRQSNVRAKLVLIGEYELSGTILALKSIHTQDNKDGVDSLIISFVHAKFSLVRWDHDNHRISTTSIHYYENDPIPRQPCDIGANYNSSILTVDPSSRCVALKFDQRQLAILPFRQTGGDLQELDEDMENGENNVIKTNGITQETPYKKSFVLSLPSLDDSLTDVIDLAFLHNYREPTFGILTSTGQASAALWSEGKDILTYHILTLDLEQGASTILASIPQLPANLWKIKPLPAPIGGALLIGTNELVHVAQSGKTHAVIVNEFAELTGGFTTSDQAFLDLKLEDCVLEVLDDETGDLLFAFSDGKFAVLHFSMLGPDVKSLSFKVLADEDGGTLLQALPSCIAALDNDLIFVGSDEADSLLLQCHKVQSSRKRSHAEMVGHVDEPEEEDDDDDDDDLYATTTRRTRASTKAASRITKLDYTLEISDSLHGLGPMSKPCLGRSSSANGKLEFAAITGRARGSRLAIMSKNIRTTTDKSFSIEDAKASWSVRAVKPKRKNQSPPDGPDNLLFVFKGSSTSVYQAPWLNDDAELVEIKDTEFEADGDTIEIGTLGSGRWIVHCRQSEVRTYEPDLSLSQIIPMADDDTENELIIVHAQFCDPYLLIIRSDNSLTILSYDAATQDVEPIELTEAITTQKCIGGSIYKGSMTDQKPAVFILLDDGSLQILSLPNAEVLFTSQNLSYLPPVLSTDAAQRRVGARETLTEILVTDIGLKDAATPYLIIRTSADDLVFYEPFHTSPQETWTDGLRYRKVPVSYLPAYDEFLEDEASQRIAPLRPIKIGRYLGVVVPGKPPCLVVSESSSRPRILRLEDVDLISISGLQQLAQADDESSFSTVSRSGSVLKSSLSTNMSVSTGWYSQTVQIGSPEDELKHIAFHKPTGMYVVSTSRPADFLFHEEDTRHPDQDDITSRPKVPQYSLHLFSAASHRVISTLELDAGEAVTSVEVMPLQVSEHTHELKHVVCIGTAQLRGEDMPTKGALIIFDLLPVIPEPGDEETGVRLHQIACETTKGAVTTVAHFAAGLIGISQGQKIMVRGLKEDGSCLPVAFLDCQCQLTTLKTLWQTGLWLAGDAWKGVWLGGFTEDPYKLTFLGKSQTRMEVLCAEFLPFEEQLFVLVVDADMNLHVLQYDPEDPKTVSGARLLDRASFKLGQWPTSMTIVPSTLAPLDEQQTNGDTHHQLYQILVTTQSGAIGLITPLDNAAYRRLSNLHAQLTTVLEHPAALNPKLYRAADGDAAGARGVVDGMIIRRVGELGSARRAEILSRCGSDAWTMRSDLEVIGGGGLTWL